MTTFFSNMGRRHTGIPLSARFSTSTCQIDWLRWTKWPGVLQVAPEITGPDRLGFFLWGYVKDRVYVPPLPATVDELQERITAAVNSVTPDMLQSVWSELDYRNDVCRLTRRGANWVFVCDVTWNCMGLCNCSHQFCKNIPVSFDFITTWNQGVFLCSRCTDWLA